MRWKKRTILCGVLLGVTFGVSTSCSDSNNKDKGATSTTFNGTVSSVDGGAVAGVTVYLVPTDMIDMRAITAAGILARTTEAFDEPLEDLIAAAGTTFEQALTDAAGEFQIDDVPDGRFFVFAQPALTDLEHMPGGSLCRVSYSADELRGIDLNVMLSSSPSAAATYVGMTQCLVCHPAYETENELAHRLGFRVPGVSSPLQSTAVHTEVDDGLSFFLDGTAYTDGTPVFMSDYDSTRGFDDFIATLDDPTPGGGVVFAKLWLWRDTSLMDPVYKITIENVGNPAAFGTAGHWAEREVKLTYGGAVFKQRYMIEWPGLNGLYPILQYQTIGSDSIFDRTRKQFRDYHLDFYWDDNGTPTETDDLIATPSITRNIARNCMGCHAPGYTQFTDMVTGEVLCDAVEDRNGEYDIDGDGFLNDLNVSCESCHGPGSEHVAGMGAGGRFVLSPEYITASRSTQICMRCHDRQVGNGTVKNDHPLNAADEWPAPGISRNEYLTDYTTRPGPAAGSYWTDFAHSKSHHQQGPDFVRSKHHRNEFQLLDCATCHNMHGGTGHEFGLREDPDAPDTELCMSCHRADFASTTEHTAAVLGVPHGGFVASCSECHMTKTAKTGAGRYGYQLGAPTGTAADADTAYFENDISSHTFDVISKDNVGVRGVQPLKAMPVPYTNRCGTCHDPSTLPF